jgi:GYF domain 2
VAGSGEKWRWADPQGVQRVMYSDELRSALASGTLPPYTLVWRRGMQEWIPAYQVAELATHAISASQGVISNIPPPPLAIIAVQAEFEHRVNSFEEEEPPLPPVHQYDAIAAAVPAHILRASKAAAEASPPAPRGAHAASHASAPAAATPAPPVVAETPVPPAVTPPPPAATPAPPAVAATSAPPLPAADVDDDAKTWVAQPAVVGPLAATAKPPVVPRAPTAPKPRVVVPPRATPSVAPQVPEPAHAAPPPPAPAKITEPPSAPDASKLPPPSGAPMRTTARPADIAHLGPLPPLPGALRSAPPPPPPRRSQPAPHGQALPGVPGALPHAPLPPPVAPGAKAALELQPAPAVLPAPPGFPPPSNGGSPPLPHLAPPPVVASLEAHTPSVHDLPAFPLDEIEPDDIEEDDGDAVELPLKHGIGSKMIDGIRVAKSSIVPLAGKAKDRISPVAGRTKEWFSTKVGPRVEQGFAYVKANPKDPKVLIGLGGAALLVLLLVVGIAVATGGKKDASADASETSQDSDSKPKAKSNESTAVAPTAGKAVEPAAVETRTARGGACKLTKEAVRLAGKASKEVPLEVAVNAAGDRARIGFATEAGAAQGLAVDLGTLKAVQEFSAPAKGKPRVVLPLGAEGKANFVVNADAPGDKVRAWRTLSNESLSVIGWADGAVAVASKSTDAPTSIWPLDGDDAPDAFRVASAGDMGQVVAFRRKGEIFGGTIDRDQKPRGNAVKVAGAGAPAGSQVGAPSVATNGHAVAITFADRAASSDPWGVRIGSANLGLFPTQTRGLAVPPGGPGGAAIAPAIAGLSDGRWMLVWTEGSGGDHDVRAETLDAELRPVGTPVTVSHGSSNAGQGAVALSGGLGMVAYLALTDQGYEVWGAAVDCR